MSLFTFEELHRAWLECRRGKRGSHSALAFERHLEHQLTGLLAGLRERTYEPSPYTCFVSDGPKPREIFAAAFRDRIIHTLLVRRLEPLWEPRFIHDSYGCRLGKGPLRGVDRLQTFMRRATCNLRARAWFLQVDVKSFFVSIDRTRLLEMLMAGLPGDEAQGDPGLAWLCRVVLSHDPTVAVVRKGRGFERIPSHKSLFHAPHGVGLPIGNHTSQFFANVYLDPLDQYVKRTLKAACYVRFVDDMVLVHRDPEVLAGWAQAIDAFLRDRLALSLHPTRRALQPCTNGCDFLGYVVRPTHRLVRRRIVNRLRVRLDAFSNDIVQRTPEHTTLRFREPVQRRLLGAIASYRGILRQASTRRLARATLDRHPWLRVAVVASRRGVARRDLLRDRARSLAAQYRMVGRSFPRAVVLMQVGCYLEAFGRSARPAAAWFGLAPGRHRKGLGRGVGFRVDRLAERLAVSLPAGARLVVVTQTGRVRGDLQDRRAVLFRSVDAFGVVERPR